MDEQHSAEHEKKFRKRSGTTNKGDDYEDLLAALLAFKLAENDEIKNFDLSSNNSKYGKFDDIVLECEYHNTDKKNIYLVQMKYKNETKKITPTHLGSIEGRFSIQQYFKSYEEFRSKLPSNFNCVIYTNMQCEFSENFEFSLKEYNNLKLKVLKQKQKNFLNTSPDQFVYKFQIVCNEDETTAAFREFLDHFYLYPNQRDVDQMKSFIQDEFLKTYFCKENVFLGYMDYISNWSKYENAKKYLNKNMVIAKIGELVLRPYLSSCSSTKDFDDNLLYKACLQCDIAVASFNLNFFSFCDKIETSKEDFEKIKQDFHINNETEEDQAIVLWHMMKNPLIVRCDEHNKNTIYKVIRSFETKCPERKFVVISDSVDREEFKNFKLMQNLNDVFSICDQEIVDKVKNKTVLLQGRQCILNDIIMLKDIADILTIDELFKLNCIQLGENKEELPAPYISQFLSKTVVSFEFINNLDFQNLIVINCNGRVDVVREKVKNATIIKLKRFLEKDAKKDQLSYERTVVVAKNRCSAKKFKQICERSNGKKCHLFYINNKLDLEWIDTSGDGKPFLFLKKLTINESDMFDDNKLISIISAKPGAGKSVMLKYLKHNIPNKYWILSLNFRDHIPFYSNQHTVDETLQYFLNFQNKCMAYNSLSRQVRNIYEKQKNLVFLWDGLDELPKECILRAIETIQMLSNVGFLNWITTRDNLQPFLEEQFKTFALTINEMNREDQENYIRKQIQILPNHEELGFMIKKITDLIALTRDVKFLGIPLRIYMLTDLFVKDPLKYRDLLDSTVTLPDIIHHFVMEKCKFSYKDKGNYTPSENDFIDRALDGNTHYRLLQYEILALRTLLPDVIFEDLNINISDILSDIEQIKDDFGLLSKIDVSSKTAIFVHNIYGEYFVATWMARNLDKVKTFKNFIFESDYRSIRIMFDLILSKGCPAHVAIIHRNFTNLKNHQEDINLKDKGGRSPLHLICSWGEPHPLLEHEVENNTFILSNVRKRYLLTPDREYVAILSFILKHLRSNLFDEDTLFSMNAIQYADCALSLLAIDLILEHENIKFGDLENFRDLISVSFYSVVCNYERIFNCLEKIEYVVDKQNRNNLLHLAVLNGRNHFLVKLLSFHKYAENVNEMNYERQIIRQPFSEQNVVLESKQNPLHLAAKTGNLEAIHILTENDASINHQDSAGRTALHLAIMSGHLELISVLLNKGCLVNVPDINGNTSLHYVIHTGNLCH